MHAYIALFVPRLVPTHVDASHWDEDVKKYNREKHIFYA